MEKYEKKYTELSRYVDNIVASESDICKRFEKDLRRDIHKSITIIAKWTKFSQLVETTLRVEQSLVEEKLEVESSRDISSTSSFRG